MKRPQRRTNYNMVTVFGEEVPAPRSGDVVGDTMIYSPSTDELSVQMWEGAWFRIAPGRRFAGELARTMAAAEAAVEQAATLPNVNACPRCEVLLKSVETETGTVHLNAKPDQNGIYVLVGEDRARMLRPLEEPVGPTFTPHTCPAWKEQLP